MCLLFRYLIMEKVSKINILFNFFSARDNKKESRPTPGGKRRQRQGGGLPPYADKNKKGCPPKYPQEQKGSIFVCVQGGRGRSVAIVLPHCCHLCCHQKPCIFNTFLRNGNNSNNKKYIKFKKIKMKVNRKMRCLCCHRPGKR